MQSWGRLRQWPNRICVTLSLPSPIPCYWRTGFNRLPTATTTCMATAEVSVNQCCSVKQLMVSLFLTSSFIPTIQRLSLSYVQGAESTTTMLSHDIEEASRTLAVVCLAARQAAVKSVPKMAKKALWGHSIYHRHSSTWQRLTMLSQRCQLSYSCLSQLLG